MDTHTHDPSFFARHKLAVSVGVIVVAGAGFFTYRGIRQTTTPTRYVLAAVERGTLTRSVSGSGQVAVVNQVDVKAKVSGDVLTVGPEEGQPIRANAIIAQLDTRDAAKAVRDAQTNLDAARLSLERIQKPPEPLEILQAENAVTAARVARERADDDLMEARADGFTAVASAFLDLPPITTGLQDLLYGTTVSGGGRWNIDAYTDYVKEYDARALTYRRDTDASYQTARTAYDRSFSTYKASNRSADAATIDALMRDTYETARAIAEATKSTSTLIQFYKDTLTARSLKTNALADTHLATLNGYTGKTNTHLSALLGFIRSVETSQETIASADRSLAERTGALAKLRAGADALDIRSQELTIQQRVNSLADARERLTDSTIRAPFDGILAKRNVKRGDTVGANAVVATLITTARIASITLNEVDVADVRVGQRATLTFDAIPELRISGSVSTIDTVGTIAQGVVSYTIEITFDTQEERVKPGMSVSAAITTDTKPDVLLIPNAAVKTQGDARVVEVVDDPVLRTPSATNAAGVTLAQPTRRQVVELGLVSDEFTEVTAGLSEGDIVVVGTLTPSAPTSAAPRQQSIGGLRIPGAPGGGGGGGAGRFR
ncbi:efflux RND transporter periplasmic adaptor subunit [Candidatus Uhrbacteria bacterium]|nr:efflux RND transporter periplasmic adaptor subunit [Candidatus Uhrbacteria bacterium]